jgi:hypothetical protein
MLLNENNMRKKNLTDIKKQIELTFHLGLYF